MRDKLKIAGIAKLPTRWGNFKVVAFDKNQKGINDIALIKGTIKNKKGVLVRIQSECLTGEVFGSLRCDCQEQLERSLQIINKNEGGTIIYLRQEGRGIGLRNKILAYQLQDQGLDTVEANLALGLPVDGRNFKIAAQILNLLQVKSIKLLTNNPQKASQLKKDGIIVEKIIPIQPTETKYNRRYLLTKKTKLEQRL
jgi:3,4-dihydroxy 2-butanone 4-phosphate synthase/GTP cyclohydrolase II